MDSLALCQCCQTREQSEVYLSVDDKFKIKFCEVIGVEMPAIESIKVCLKCHNKVEEFFLFKKEVLERQMKSVYLIDENIKSPVCPLSSVKVEYLLSPEPLNNHRKSQFCRQEFRSSKKSIREKKELSKSCPICLKVFKNRRTIKDHIMRVHETDNKSISCDRCGYACYTRFEIQNHMRKQHLPRVEDSSLLRVCPYCAKVMKGNNHLNSHIKMKHLKVVKFICDLCPFRTHGAYEIRRHIEIHHLPLASRKNFPCDFPDCGAVLTTAGSLAIHKKLKHEKEKNHICPLCGKRFALARLVTSHMQNVHLGSRPVACSFKDCDKRFVNKNQLNSHVKRVHMGIKEEVPPCHVCGKVLTTKNHLNSHMRFHRNPKFSCEFCEKKFFDNSKLRSHTETAHLGKTFDCELCDKKFQSLRGFQRHVKSRHQ